MPTAAEITSPTLVSIDAEVTVSEAINRLVDECVSGAPVMREGKLVGFVSELELFDVLFDPSLRSRPVSEVMETEVHVVDEAESLAQVAHTFALLGIRQLPVTRNGTPVGIVSRSDLLRFSAKYDQALQDPLSQLMPSIDEESL
jgi:CBS domain-containing protein